MKSLDRNKWFKYIKLYEEFNREIPEELKTVYQKMRNDIGTPDKSFRKLLNLNDYDFVDLLIELNVNFIKKEKQNLPYTDREIKYYSNFNLYDLITGKSPIQMDVIIEDIEMNPEKLCSLLAHELRYVYDAYSNLRESDLS